MVAVNSYLPSSLLGTCQSTADCGEDFCCRDIHGNVITGFSIGPFGKFVKQFKLDDVRYFYDNRYAAILCNRGVLLSVI